MKAYIWIPFALLLGLLIGGWGTRSELRTAKDELRDTKKLLQQTKKRGGGSDVGQVTRLLGIDGQTERHSRNPAQDDQKDDAKGGPPDPVDAEDLTATAGAGQSPGSNETEERVRDRNQQRNMEEEIETAIELWKLRSEIARSTFLSNGNFSDEAAGNFDVLIEAMNIRLAHTMETWAADVETKEVTAEDGIRLMGEVTGALVLTYDEMDRKLPQNWRNTGGKSMQLMDFIDPSVARPLIRVESKLNDVGQSFDQGQNSP